MKTLLIDPITAIEYKYTFSLANAIRDQGCDISLIADDVDSNNNYCKCSIENMFLISRKDIGKFKKAINYIKTYDHIVNKAISENVDIIHTQWFQLSPIDYYFLKKAKSKGVHIVATVHDIMPFNTKFYDKIYFRKLYDLSDRIIVQAEANIHRFNELFPECSNKVEYIPHGHYLDFSHLIDQESARKRMNIPTNKFVFLFFGQIKKVKGVDILLKAFSKLAKEREDVYLIVAGNTWKADYSYYKKIAEEGNLNADKLRMDIRFIPDELIDYYYSACDVAVLPYTDVYQSGVVQLAYSYDKPAIVSSLKPFTEVVKGGESGLTFDAGNEDELYKTMNQAANMNHNDLLVMAHRGKEYISHKYSWEIIGEKTYSLYKDIVNKK